MKYELWHLEDKYHSSTCIKDFPDQGRDVTPPQVTRLIFF